MAKKSRNFTITIISLAVIIVLTIITCFAVLFFMGDKPDGLNGSSATVNSSISCSEITKKIIAKMNYKDIAELGSGNVAGHFVIPDGSVTQSSICISSSAEEALEIDCFKLTDASYESQLKSAVADHMSTKAKGFKDNDDQLKLIQNYCYASYGGFVFVAVSDNAEVAEKYFKDIVDGKE